MEDLLIKDKLHVIEEIRKFTYKYCQRMRKQYVCTYQIKTERQYKPNIIGNI